MWSVEPGERLVYGAIAENPDGAVVPEREAERLKVIRTVRTWGELRAGLSAEEVADILELSELGDEDVIPADDAPFDRAAVWGWHDGDWPDWPQQRMGDWMPDDLLEEYAVTGMTVLNGEYLGIPVERLDDLACELEARGHPCRRDDALLALISGY